MSIEIVLPKEKYFYYLVNFFNEINNSEDIKLFHPHKFDNFYASYLCKGNIKDLHYLVIYKSKVIGYGLLRGWDEGFDIPFLGIYISKDYRGKGIGKMLMLFLHTAAKMRDVKEIRLKVYKDNLPAKALYESLGYKFIDNVNEYLGVLKF